MNEFTGSGELSGGHVDIERLLAYAHHEASADECDAVLQHTRGCRECGDELAVMLALAGTAAVVADGAPGDVASPMAPPRFGFAAAMAPRRVGPIAAGVVLAVLVGIVLAWTGLPIGSGTDADLTALATEEPPVDTMAGFLFGGETVSTARDARAGFLLIVEGRYDEAVVELSAVYAARPDAGEAAAALGIARYLAGDDSRETEGLLLQGRALVQQDWRNLAAWYLGNLYLKRGDVVQARGVFEELAREEDDSGDRARAVLGQLGSEVR